MRSLGRRTVACLASVALIGSSCGSGDAADSAADAPSTDDVSGDVVVFAAASLTDAFTEIGAAFEADHPDASVTFNFASSSDLATQILEGAPADVFASADEANMTKLTDAGGVAGKPRVLATNALQIIVEPGNPKGISSVADLAGDVIFVTCSPEVPIGRYAAEVLERAGVVVEPASLEESVKGIVTKVTLGEADAGIVYRTDVIAAGSEAQGVDIADALDVIATYPLVVTEEAPNPVGGQAFIDFVLGEAAQEILGAFGFGRP